MAVGSRIGQLLPGLLSTPLKNAAVYFSINSTFFGLLGTLLEMGNQVFHYSLAPDFFRFNCGNHCGARGHENLSTCFEVHFWFCRNMSWRPPFSNVGVGRGTCPARHDGAGSHAASLIHGQFPLWLPRRARTFDRSLFSALYFGNFLVPPPSCLRFWRTNDAAGVLTQFPPRSSEGGGGIEGADSLLVSQEFARGESVPRRATFLRSWGPSTSWRSLSG